MNNWKILFGVEKRSHWFTRVLLPSSHLPNGDGIMWDCNFNRRDPMAIWASPLIQTVTNVYNTSPATKGLIWLTSVSRKEALRHLSLCCCYNRWCGNCRVVEKRFLFVVFPQTSASVIHNFRSCVIPLSPGLVVDFATSRRHYYYNCWRISLLTKAAGQRRVKPKPVSCIARRDLRLLGFFSSWSDTTARTAVWKYDLWRCSVHISLSNFHTAYSGEGQKWEYLKCACSVFSLRAKGLHTPSFIFNHLSPNLTENVW